MNIRKKFIITTMVALSQLSIVFSTSTKVEASPLRAFFGRFFASRSSRSYSLTKSSTKTDPITTIKHNNPKLDRNLPSRKAFKEPSPSGSPKLNRNNWNKKGIKDTRM